MKILVNPDIHGRTFWESNKNVDEYDKIIFLGDYVDPYPFEKISVSSAVENFRNIIEFKKAYPDKVILLLGNHDMPYYSSIYYNFSSYFSRHSREFHDVLHKMFNENKELFQIACTYDNILFTHAGCTPGWILTVFTEQYKLTSLDDLVFSLNNLVNTRTGLSYLFMISSDRGGYDKYASCIWADASDTMWYQYMLNDPSIDIANNVYDFITMKQVYGHTLSAYYDTDGSIKYGDITECNNNKMLDNCRSYILDTELFEVKAI